MPAALLSQRQVHNMHPTSTSISIQRELQFITSRKVHGSSWIIVFLLAHEQKCTSSEWGCEKKRAWKAPLGNAGAIQGLLKINSIFMEI